MPCSPKTRGRRRIGALAGALLGAVVLLVPALPAGADPYGVGGSNAGPLPDDRTEDWCTDGALWYTEAFALQAVRSRMENLDNQTWMTQKPIDRCGTSTSIDIKFVIDNNMFARYSLTCNGLFVNNHCNQAILRINLFRIQQDVTSTDTTWYAINVLKELCHAIGRVVGLEQDVPSQNRYKTDCMKNGDVTGQDFATVTTYDAHHVEHINMGVRSTS